MALTVKDPRDRGFAQGATDRAALDRLDANRLEGAALRAFVVSTLSRRAHRRGLGDFPKPPFLRETAGDAR